MYPVYRSIDGLLQCENFPKKQNSQKYHLLGPCRELSCLYILQSSVFSQGFVGHAIITIMGLYPAVKSSGQESHKVGSWKYSQTLTVWGNI